MRRVGTRQMVFLAVGYCARVARREGRALGSGDGEDGGRRVRVKPEQPGGEQSREEKANERRSAL